MATILPFRAVRPTRDKVSLVASRAYDSYTQQEREARLRDNPFSFLHIVNPGFKYQQEIVGKDRYQLVRNRYLEFREEGVFTQDNSPCYYIYKIVDRDHNAFHGIVAAASIADYQENRIRRHEDTLSKREEVFKEYLDTVGFNAEAVLLTYPDDDGLKMLMNTVMSSRAEYEFTTTYRDTHYLWPVHQTDITEKIQKAFEGMEALYIADGHHRSASSFLLAQEHPVENGNLPSQHYFMSFLIPESELIISEFNRLVTDLNGLSKQEFLIALDRIYRIEDRGAMYYRPTQKHHFTMYLGGSYYSLYLRKDQYPTENALEQLDAQILNNTILEGILGIKDPRTDGRLAYSHGKKGLAHVQWAVDSGDFEVGFGLLPVSVEEMKNIADQGLTMPPKSTYIEPKLRSGVTIYEF